MEATKIQLNASLRFNPAGELIGRDLLVNFREQSVAECVKLLADFNRQFGLNLGLSQLPAPAKTIPATIRQEQSRQNDYNQQVPRCNRCNIPMQLRTCRKPGKYFNASFYSCPNWRLNGCLEKVAA